MDENGIRRTNVQKTRTDIGVTTKVTGDIKYYTVSRVWMEILTRMTTHG